MQIINKNSWVAMLKVSTFILLALSMTIIFDVGLFIENFIIALFGILVALLTLIIAEKPSEK